MSSQLQKNTNSNLKNYSDNKYLEEAYDLTHRYRNLEDPLGFIESQNIKSLKNNYDHTKHNMKKDQDSIAQFSKSIYKKVISRDNDYNFEKKIQAEKYDIMYAFNQKYSKTGQLFEEKAKYKGQDLQRKYKHGEVTSKEAKRQREREQKQIPLTFAHVKLIDTPEFDQKCKDVEFYNIIRDNKRDKNYNRNSNQIDNLAIINQLDNFRHKLIEDSQYFTKHSYNFLFNSERELKFWKLNNIFKQDKKTQQTILATCAFLDTYNISIFQMFDFASRNIEIDDIVRFYKLKKSLQSKMQMQKNNQNLEQKYNQAKKRFQQMKQLKMKSKNQRLPAKFVSTLSQTNDQMVQKQFDDYFVQDAKNIFDRLRKLNDIRDRIVIQEESPTFNVMATNIGIQIGKQLFKLLMLMLKGENFPNYSQFLNAQNQQQVERKILQLIYLQFSQFRQFEVNGISKFEIIKVYLEQREKNERFYETYLFNNSDK